MAEFVMKNLVNMAGLSEKFIIDSAATSTEEIGNGMHNGTKAILSRMRIPYSNHFARQLTYGDGEEYDYIIGMDRENLFYIKRILGPSPNASVCLLLEFAGIFRDIADPWYTGNFDDTYRDIDLGCRKLLEKLTH